MLSEQVINSGQIVQLTCKSIYNGKTYYVIGKRFDKKCIYLVESNDVQNVSNFDNSFFEIERFEGVDNKVNNQEPEEGEKPIKFGDQMRFKHINSGKYLSVAREYTEKSKGSFKILLDEDTKSADNIFQIMPYRTFQKLADQIRYKSKVNIYNQEEQIYLNIEGYSKDEKQNMKALVGTHVAQSQWEINFYALNYNPTNEIIRDKDLVYMVNSKSSGLLTLNYKQAYRGLAQDSKNDLQLYDFVLKQLPITYPIKKQPKSFGCIWQISIRTQDGNIKQENTQTMGLKKGNIELNISFTHLIQQNRLFQNLVTRLVYPQQLSNKISDNRQTRRISGQTIASGQYIRIGKQKSSKQSSAMNLQWLGQTTKAQKNLEANYNKKSHNCTLKRLNFIEHQGDSVVFQIIRIPEDLKKEIYEFIQAKQRIQAFMDSLKDDLPKEQQAIEQQSDRFVEAEQILKHITQSLNIQKNNHQAVLQRQMILNDIGFIEIIMKCLRKLTQRDKMSGKTQQSSKLKDKFHDILRHCCTDNKQIKSSLSINYLLELLELSDIESNDSSDTETLKEIMKDNKYAIQNIMNPDEVKKLINNFYSQPMSISVYHKFIQILRLICKTTEEVIPRNQKVVIQQFLQKNMATNQEESSLSYVAERKNIVCFDFKLSENQEVKIVTPKHDKNNKEAFPQLDEQIHFFFKSNVQQSLAFLQWLQLIADVCQNKNILGKRFAESKFGPRIIEAFLNLPNKNTIMLDVNDLQIDDTPWNPYFPKKTSFILHRYIIRIVNNAFIKTIYRKKKMFDRIFIFNRVQNKKQPPLERYIQKLNIFINSYISRLKGYLNSLNNSQNDKSEEAKKQEDIVKDQRQVKMDETTKNVFMLLKNMIMYGLYEQESNEVGIYKNSQDVHKLIPRLLQILQDSKKDTVYKPEILEIINFYMNLDLRERVQKAIVQIKELIAFYQEQGKPRLEILREVEKLLEKNEPTKINKDQISRFIQIMLEVIEKQKIKEKGIFILCLNTLSKFVEVQRIFRIRVRETLVIDSKDKSETTANLIKQARNYFQLCDIKDLKDVSLKDQYELNVTIWDKKQSSVIKYILQIMMAMKEQEHFQNQNQYVEIYNRACNTSNLLAAYNECQKPNSKIQKMVKQMKLHKYFYGFIKQMTNDVQQELSKKLLEIIYLCLAVFAWKNYQNKNELSHLLPYMLEHAENNNGSIETLRQFFSQNPSILYDQQKITRVTETITNYIHARTLNEEPRGHGHKFQQKTQYNFNYAAKLLDFLHALITEDSNKQDRNKILVLSYILDKDRLLITKPKIIESIVNRVKHFQSPAQYNYLGVLFGLLAQLVDDQSINIAKCKKLHKLEVLVDIMKLSSSNIKLKSYTRDYVNKLYYKSFDNSYVEAILNTELDTFIYDLDQYIIYRKTEQAISKSLLNDEPKIQKNPIRYTFEDTFYYLNLQKILDSLSLITKHNLFEDQFKKTEAPLNSMGETSHKSIIKKITQLYERLRYICISYFYQNTKLKQKFRSILKYFEIKIFQFDFKKREFLNTGTQKIVNFKQMMDEEDKKTAEVSERNQKNDDQNQKQQNLCSKILSNTQIGKHFLPLNQPSREKYNKMKNDKLKDSVLSFIVDKQGTGTTGKFEAKTSIKKILKTMLKSKVKDSEKFSSLQETYQDIIGQISHEKSQEIDKRLKKEEKDEKTQKTQKDEHNQIDNKLQITYEQASSQDATDKRKKYRQMFSLGSQNFKNVRPQEVFRYINSMISENYQIFQPKNLTFYFRTLSQIIQPLKNKQSNKDFNKDPTNFIITLCNSFSELMFKTIISCNLQQNIEVSYWFFKFVANYWDVIKQSKTQPDKLYKLIKDDPKNEFLVKLDNFIVFLSNDISRKLQHPESSRQSPLNIFDLKSLTFKEVKTSEYGYLNKKIQSSHIFDTFKNIFQFMQLICQNNFVQFKTELRQQKIQKSIKTNNKNLLIRSTIELRKLFKMYRPTIQDLPDKILDFLNQIAQIPCYDNQIELSKSTFFQDVCQFISDQILSGLLIQDEEKRSRLKQVEFQNLKNLYSSIQNIIQRFFKIILSLLQSNMAEIYNSFVQKLDPNFFDYVIRIHENNPSSDKDKLKNKESKINKLIIYMLIIRQQLTTKIPNDSKILPKIISLTPDQNDGQNNEKNTSKNNAKKNSKKQFNNIESIEVRLDDKQHKLYFFKSEETIGINDKTKYIQERQQELNRSTHLQKLDSLLAQRKNLELYMVYQNDVRKSRYWIILYFLYFNYAANIISLLINLILIMTTSITIVGDYVNSYESWKILLPLQIIQFIIGTFYFFSDTANHILKKKLDRFYEQNTSKGRPEVYYASLSFQEWWQIINDKSSSIIYYVVCLLGLFVSPYYYSIHLLFLFSHIKVLQNVFKAIASNIYQLMFLAILGIAFFVVFSILSINTYAPYAQEQYCNSIWECFLVIYNKEIFMEESESSETHFTSLFFQILYSVFFGALFGNIISGLMTDTFAELRDRQDSRVQDEGNCCYICGRSKFQIERENEDNYKLSQIYTKHIQKHYKWSYLFYLYQLQKKDKTQYTGLEYIISKRVQKNSVAWFPIKKTEENADINKIKEQLYKLETMT